MTKQQYTAGIIRRILTASDVDLRRGSKSEIESLIIVGLNKAEGTWPVYVQEITAPRHEGHIRYVMAPDAPLQSS